MSACGIILTVIIIIIVFYFLFGNRPVRVERYEDLMNTQFELNALNGNNDLSNLAIDQMKCEASCCGFNGIDYDGLDYAQTNAAIAQQLQLPHGDYVRTNYTCSGPNGMGCPCVTPQAYVNLVTRGNPASMPISEIQPTYRVGPYNQESDVGPFRESTINSGVDSEVIYIN